MFDQNTNTALKMWTTLKKGLLIPAKPPPE